MACCNYTSAELNPNDRNNLDDDPYVANLRKTDPNWNNCDINTIDSILKHAFFNKHISEENWASDNPPAMCVTCCNHKENQ